MTEEEIRSAIATAIIQSGYDDTDDSDDAVMLFEWHHCFDTPACGSLRTPPSPCPCSGVPYLSEAVWAKVGPVVRGLLAERGRPEPEQPGMVADDCGWCRGHGYTPGQQLTYEGVPVEEAR